MRKILLVITNKYTQHSTLVYLLLLAHPIRVTLYFYNNSHAHRPFYDIPLSIPQNPFDFCYVLLIEFGTSQIELSIGIGMSIIVQSVL